MRTTARPARRQVPRKMLPYITLTPATLLFAFPLVWLALGVFMPAGELLSRRISPIPSHWTIQNLDVIFNGSVDLPGYAWNTFVLCTLRAAGTIASSSLAAYALTKLRFRGRNVIFGATLCLLVMPTWAMLVPQYRLFAELGWLGSMKPLIVPLVFGDPFTIFLLSAFMRAVPVELSEAAEIDGASHLQTYWHIILPNIKSALVVAAVLSVIDTYNDFFGQIIYLTRNDQYTLALAAFQYVKVHGAPDIGAILAFTAVSMLPLIVLFFVAQRQLRETNISSGLKG